MEQTPHHGVAIGLHHLIFCATSKYLKVVQNGIIYEVTKENDYGQYSKERFATEQSHHEDIDPHLQVTLLTKVIKSWRRKIFSQNSTACIFEKKTELIQADTLL